MTNSPNIISREEAKALGLKRFFTGKKCVHGHVSQRYTKTRICVKCSDLHSLKRTMMRQAIAKTKIVHGVEKIISRQDAKEIGQAWYFTGKPCKKSNHVSRRSVSNCGCQQCCLERYHNNPQIRLSRILKETGKIKRFDQERDRRMRIMNLLMSRLQRNKIKDFYKNVPDGFQVDHIVPIMGGDVVCGLHNIHNLQYLKKSENLRKKNRFPYCWRSKIPAFFDTVS